MPSPRSAPRVPVKAIGEKDRWQTPLWLHQRTVVGRGTRSGSSPALKLGEVIRDFPYFISASEVAFFSTHPNFCEDIFGLRHGERLRFGSGLWEGQSATAVGTRAGRLFVVRDGYAVCQALPVSLDAVASNFNTSALRTLKEKYHITISDASISSDAFPAEVRQRVQRAVNRHYTAPQQQFLQRAPDLFVNMQESSETGKQDTPSYREYVIVPSTNRSFTILSPKIVSASGVMGWVGEESLRSLYPGPQDATVSLSASIIV